MKPQKPYVGLLNALQETHEGMSEMNTSSAWVGAQDAIIRRSLGEPYHDQEGRQTP